MKHELVSLLNNFVQDFMFYIEALQYLYLTLQWIKLLLVSCRLQIINKRVGLTVRRKLTEMIKKNKDNTWLKHSYNDLFLLGKFEIWKNTERKLWTCQWLGLWKRSLLVFYFRFKWKFWSIIDIIYWFAATRLVLLAWTWIIIIIIIPKDRKQSSF